MVAEVSIDRHPGPIGPLEQFFSIQPTFDRAGVGRQPKAKRAGGWPMAAIHRAEDSGSHTQQRAVADTLGGSLGLVSGVAGRDQQKAVSDYRTALALGATVPLPQLFAAAGAKFAFDAGTLKQAVDLIEEVINEMEAKL